MLRQIADNTATLLGNEIARTAAGISIGLVSCYIPFAASFYLCRFSHLTLSRVAGFEGVIAGAGLAACVVAIVAVYDSRKSLKSLAMIAPVMMALIGLLVSLCV